MALLFLPHTLDASVSKLPDVGPAFEKRLGKLGIATIRDLLLTLPFGWETYEGPSAIASLTPGVQATVVGRVVKIFIKTTTRKKMRLTEAMIEDDSGERLRVAWFNNPYVVKNLNQGDRVAIAGMVKSGYGGVPEMQSPHYERLDGDPDAQPSRVGGLMPKYHLVNGLTNRKVAQWVESALPLAGQVEDVLPDEVRARHKLMDVEDAIRLGHKPETDEDFRGAKKRMAFAELFELQAAFAMMRARMAAEPDEPAAQRRCRFRQNGRRRGVCGDGPRLRPAVGGHGADRDPGAAASSQVPRLPRGKLSRPDRRAVGEQPERAGTAPRADGGRFGPLRPSRRHARVDRGRRRARQSGPRGGRRAASLRHPAARAAAGEGKRPSAFPGHDGHADTTHAGAGLIRRDDDVRDRRDASGANAGADRGRRSGRPPARVQPGARRGGGRAPGIRDLSIDRRFGSGGGAVCDRGVRATEEGHLSRPPARPHPRSPQRQRTGHAAIRRRRDPGPRCDRGG